MPTNARLSLVAVEVLSAGTGDVRTSQVPVEVLHAGSNGDVRLSAVAVEVLSATAPAGNRVSQTGALSLQQADNIAVSQLHAVIGYQKDEIAVTEIGLYIVQGGQEEPPEPPVIEECVLEQPSINCWGESDPTVSCVGESDPSTDCWSGTQTPSADCLDEHEPTRGGCWNPHTGPPSFGVLGDDE